MNQNIFSAINRKKIIGLYIGSETVDLVVLKSTLKGPKLDKFSQTYIYPSKEKESETIIPEASDNALADNKPAQKEKPKSRNDYIIEAIKRVFKENRLKPGEVVTAIPSEEVMVRYFQMPKIPRQEWASAINFEAKRYIPFRMEDIASDYQVMQSRVSAGNMDVLFVAVKKSTIERFIALLESAGVKPVIIEPAPFSLMRAFNAAEQISNKINTAIINIDVKMANIIILRNSVPYIIRDIPLEEGRSSEPTFEKLLSETRLSFDFYEKQFPSEIIDKIIIYSQVPLENWHELVGKELQIPVEVGDPLRGIAIKKDVVPPRLAVSFGLALRGISSPFIDINLYKESLVIYKHKELFLRALFLQASAAVVLLIILKLLCLKALAPLTKEYSRTLSERPKPEIMLQDTSLPGLERIKNQMSEKKDIVENVIAGRTLLTGRLSDLAKLVPGSKIWLTEVNFEEKVDKKNLTKTSRQLKIKGYCIIKGSISETEAINNFLIDLKKGDSVNKGMTKADIVSVEKTEFKGERVARFEILFRGE